MGGVGKQLIYGMSISLVGSLDGAGGGKEGKNGVVEKAGIRMRTRKRQEFCRVKMDRPN